MPQTIRLTMLVSEYGSATPPGTDCCLYVTGETYDFPDDGPDGLAGVFLREAWAVREEEAEQDEEAEEDTVDPEAVERFRHLARTVKPDDDAPAKTAEKQETPSAPEEEHPVRDAVAAVVDGLKDVGQKIHDAVAPDEATVRARLEEKAMPDLREIAKKSKVKVGFGMRKDALIDALIAAGVKG